MGEREQYDRGNCKSRMPKWVNVIFGEYRQNPQQHKHEEEEEEEEEEEVEHHRQKKQRTKQEL